jgi:RNA polymerase sigma-70 factor, ECF subfamily
LRLRLLEEDDAFVVHDSLDAWVLATWPRAVVYARSLLRDRLGAEDIVQDCYCSLLRKADVYDLTRDGVPLLMKSITNACLKKNTRDRPMLSLSIHSSADSEGSHEIDPVHPTAAEPSSIVLHAELERAIEAALARLPIQQRAAVELKGLGHSLGEIAATLDVTVANAGVLVFRGRQALAKYLAPYLEGQTG